MSFFVDKLKDASSYLLDSVPGMTGASYVKSNDGSYMMGLDGSWNGSSNTFYLYYNFIDGSPLSTTNFVICFDEGSGCALSQFVADGVLLSAGTNGGLQPFYDNTSYYTIKLNADGSFNSVQLTKDASQAMTVSNSVVSVSVSGKSYVLCGNTSSDTLLTFKPGTGLIATAIPVSKIENLLYSYDLSDSNGVDYKMLRNGPFGYTQLGDSSSTLPDKNDSNVMTGFTTVVPNVLIDNNYSLQLADDIIYASTNDSVYIAGKTTDTKVFVYTSINPATNSITNEYGTFAVSDIHLAIAPNSGGEIPTIYSSFRIGNIDGKGMATFADPISIQDISGVPFYSDDDLIKQDPNVIGVVNNMVLEVDFYGTEIAVYSGNHAISYSSGSTFQIANPNSNPGSSRSTVGGASVTSYQTIEMTYRMPVYIGTISGGGTVNITGYPVTFSQTQKNPGPVLVSSIGYDYNKNSLIYLTKVPYNSNTQAWYPFTSQQTTSGQSSATTYTNFYNNTSGEGTIASMYISTSNVWFMLNISQNILYMSLGGSTSRTQVTLPMVGTQMLGWMKETVQGTATAMAIRPDGSRIYISTSLGDIYYINNTSNNLSSPSFTGSWVKYGNISGKDILSLAVYPQSFTNSSGKQQASNLQNILMGAPDPYTMINRYVTSFKLPTANIPNYKCISAASATACAGTCPSNIIKGCIASQGVIPVFEQYPVFWFLYNSTEAQYGAQLTPVPVTLPQNITNTNNLQLVEIDGNIHIVSQDATGNVTDYAFSNTISTTDVAKTITGLPVFTNNFNVYTTPNTVLKGDKAINQIAVLNDNISVLSSDNFGKTIYSVNGATASQMAANNISQIVYSTKTTQFVNQAEAQATKSFQAFINNTVNSSTQILNTLNSLESRVGNFINGVSNE